MMRRVGWLVVAVLAGCSGSPSGANTPVTSPAPASSTAAVTAPAAQSGSPSPSGPPSSAFVDPEATDWCPFQRAEVERALGGRWVLKPDASQWQCAYRSGDQFINAMPMGGMTAADVIDPKRMTSCTATHQILRGTKPLGMWCADPTLPSATFMRPNGAWFVGAAALSPAALLRLEGLIKVVATT